jgi:sigma-B regulation protein RsbU (phosphoserine phosphatase)
MSRQPDNLVDSLTTLNQIADSLNRAIDVQSALDSALAKLVELMGLETGWIFLRDPSAKSQWFGKDYVLAAHCHLPPAMATHRAGAWKGGCDCQGFCNKGTLTGPYNEVRCSRLAEVKGEERSGLAVHASTPLRSGDRIHGILNVAAPDWDSFTPEALALLANAGSQMGIALERARLYDMLRERRIGEQATLLQFTNQLLGQPQLAALMDYLVQEIRRLLDVDACALVMPGKQPGALEFAASDGWHDDPATRRRSMADSEFNVVSQTLLSQIPFVAEDIEDHVVPLYELEWLQDEGFRGYTILPLIVEGRSIGGLMITTRRPRLLDDDEMRLLQLMANQAALAIESARLHQEQIERERLAEEMALGRQIQLSMLPKAQPALPGWDFATFYAPARLVGGDFYDFFELPGQPARLGMVIADVADKGVAAALFMALSRTVIRTVALSGRGAAAALVRANQIILNDSQSDLFLSAVYAILEPERGRLIFANAGHNRPLWYQAASDTVRELRAEGIILGAFENVQIEDRRFSITLGDALLFYTDGITEAIDTAGSYFGEARLVEVFRAHASRSAQEIATAIVDAVDEFTRGTEQSDDVTFFVVKRLAPQGPHD